MSYFRFAGNMRQSLEGPLCCTGEALTVCVINDEAIALAFEVTVDARRSQRDT